MYSGSDDRIKGDDNVGYTKTATYTKGGAEDYCLLMGYESGSVTVTVTPKNGTATTYTITYVPTTNIETAKLHDTSGSITDDNSLISNYKINGIVYAGAQDSYTCTVDLSGTGLQYHRNGDTPESMGYWIGIAVVAPTGAKQMRYAVGTSDGTFGDLSKLTALDTEIDDAHNKGIAIYTHIGAEAKSYEVRWYAEDGTTAVGVPVIYKMNTDNVTTVPAIAGVTLYDGSNSAIATSASAALSTTTKSAIVKKIVVTMSEPVTLSANAFAEVQFSSDGKTYSDITVDGSKVTPYGTVALGDDGKTLVITPSVNWAIDQVGYFKFTLGNGVTVKNTTGVSLASEAAVTLTVTGA